MNKVDRVFGTILCGFGATIALLLFIAIEISRLGI